VGWTTACGTVDGAGRAWVGEGRRRTKCRHNEGDGGDVVREEFDAHTIWEQRRGTCAHEPSGPIDFLERCRTEYQRNIRY
jgi:hypothetical protein